MEHAEYALALNSGMSAIVAIINTLKKGDHILCVDDEMGVILTYLS